MFVDSARWRAPSCTGLAAQPEGRFTLVTPKHGSWLNLIEDFFSKLAAPCFVYPRRLHARIQGAIPGRYLSTTSTSIPASTPGRTSSTMPPDRFKPWKGRTKTRISH
jgi:hypothetical protein